MTRRYTSHMSGQQYLGNTHTFEVHDLDNEQTNCQIDEIINTRHDTPFNSLSVAHGQDFGNCLWCVGHSRR